ncbi:sorting nexin-7-like [Zootermopsis nevadensis]|uniref:sorting nexin-7-like n=1 Tax=Zootermopsis nevadensis TaxID=136037 RepID=UPI000B8EB932|nr:sorting nexin-7-like [Zootermopsis nevadensis]XP_021925635.1 sorting nexin-7-like [Zootermopsis nevadensis]XP_021925636.1 sorting nexin-7-like [Zootermopsis nevadensis]
MADSEDTAVLEVSSECKSTLLKKQDSKDTDIMSNYSTSLEGSVVASPSIESFSTLPDQEMSEFGLDTRDLQVKVDNPQKHLDTLETYITFRITTRTSRAEFDETEYVVRRRYNDFIWLRQKLVDAFPTHLIPPLPGKHTLLAQLDRYSKEFIMARMALLHRFLNRVANHPVLSCNQSVKIFLTAKPSEFSIHRKSRQGILGRMSTSFHNLAAVYMMRQRAQEFEQVREYVTTLGEKLSSVERVSQRIHKERQDYLHELHQMHPIFTLWSASEPELSPVLLAMAAAIEHNAQAQQNVLVTYTPDIAQPLKEYVLYIEAVKEALNRRDSVQIEYELTVEELKKKRAEKDVLLAEEQTSGSGGFSLGGATLWKSGGEMRDDKLQKLAQAIPQLVKQVEENQDKMECANENLRADLDRWHHEKKADLKKLFVALANQQIKYYEQCLTAWEEVLPNLKGVDTSFSSNSKSELQVSS